MKKVLSAVIIALLFLTPGCNMQNSPLKKSQPEQQSNQDGKPVQADVALAEKAKETAEQVQGVKGSAAVVVNKDITTAVKVSGFDRLRLKSIKQEVHDKIKESSKNYNVHVTSDKKLFVQLQQLEKEIAGPQEKSMPDIQKKLNKINKDMER